MIVDCTGERFDRIDPRGGRKIKKYYIKRVATAGRRCSPGEGGEDVGRGEVDAVACHGHPRPAGEPPPQFLFQRLRSLHSDRARGERASGRAFSAGVCYFGSAVVGGWVSHCPLTGHGPCHRCTAVSYTPSFPLSRHRETTRNRTKSAER